MAEIIGKMLVCDICGKSVFLKHVIHHSEPNYGGFGSYDEYENPPKGWGYCPIIYEGVTHVCPSCSEPLNELEQKRKEEVRVAEEKWQNLMRGNINKLRK